MLTTYKIPDQRKEGREGGRRERRREAGRAGRAGGFLLAQCAGVAFYDGEGNPVSKNQK